MRACTAVGFIWNSYGVKFQERREFLYDQELFGRQDVALALGLHAEYIKVHSPKNPQPRVMEVDRRSEKFDPLWHVSVDERTVFSREFEMPMLIKAQRPDWRLTRIGLVPQQQCKFWMANLHLQQADWFPMRGDYIFWNGYRNIIVNVVLEPETFWQQTNVWLGLVCETVIPAEGDARPVINPAHAVPRERIQTRPAPEL